MSNVYFTSDTHFGHRNIIDYTERPFTGVDDMDEWLILNWNETVQPDDTVWYLGDFALGPSIDRMLEVLCQLNGHKICILGNHDERTIARKSSLFTGPNLFESIYPGIVEHKFDGTHVTMCHYAMQVWNRFHRGAIMLHGHSHGTLTPDLTQRKMDVGVDAVALLLAAGGERAPEMYRPISFEEVLEEMETRQFQPIDHHAET